MSLFSPGSSAEEDHYLSPDERKAATEEKIEKVKERGLTPDWYRKEAEFRLPPGGISVAVIGAGFSGLAAAWYLKSCGVSTVVYEARNQIGGRVRTSRTLIPGKTVEEGATLIGENHALWWLLAERFGLTLRTISDEKCFPGLETRLRFGGHELDPAERQRLESELLPIWTAIGAEASTIPETEPWTDKRAAGFDAKSVKERLVELIPRGTDPNVLRWFEFTLGNDNCAPIENQSYLGLAGSVSAARMGKDPRGMLGYWLSTETHHCVGGNDKLAQKFAGFLETELRLRTAVTAVTINPPPIYPRVAVATSKRDANGKVIDRRVDHFDYVVMAAPATVWKGIKLQPPLPSPRRYTVQHGPAVKFLSQYRSEFWREEGFSPLARWDELGSVWEGTDKQPRDIPGIDLTVFSGGPFVFPEKTYPARLTALYKERAKSLIAEEFVNWSAEKFIETGYAVPGIGQASTVLPALAQPYRERLFFAGEQVSPGFYGYMEGALQTGTGAALQIMLDAID